MLETILVPLDGSQLAEATLPYATRLARASGARIWLVQAVENENVDATREAEQYLQTIASHLNQDGVSAGYLVEIGDAADVILIKVAEKRADLIAMSTHGRSGIGRWIYGSVADEVIRRTVVPILLIPSGIEHRWKPNEPFHTLVPLDGSELAMQALPAAQDLTTTFSGDIILVQVVEPIAFAYGGVYPGVFPELDIDTLVDEANRQLDVVAAQLREEGLAVSTVVKVGPTPTTIVRLAEERAASAIVIASHGSGGLTRLVLGSVATGIIQRATMPVVIVRPIISGETDETTSEAEPRRQR